MDNKDNNKLNTILRWVAFIPAAVVGSIAISAIFYYMNKVLPMFGGDNLWNKAILIISRGLFGATLVAIACAIAPAGKRVVAVVLMILLSMLEGVAIFFAVVTSAGIVEIIGCVACIVFAGITTYHVFSEE